ncbi:ACP phosphodiesterase [Enterovibrio paralichthyis]|uniref:acyl carrier protein phosphodiesterase n=1 Tax=Enterovibrio paralichthyis TaxID=2853805 RepID=UPI001C43B8C8|nr:DUF479 domain-containing protein [Enterovibrio paralichthyis]
MNYLAHLHIAKRCNSQLMGNLLADFVRGKPDGRFNPDTTQAIYLHRFVDSYIDNLPAIQSCRSLFPKSLYRFSAIALDIFWDHALVHHWQHFSSDAFSRFIENAEDACVDAARQENYPLPENYLRLSSRMWREGWIESYQDIHTLPFVLQRMSTRSPRMAPLAETADTLLTYRQPLLDAFVPIYEDVLQAALQFRKQQA